MNDSPAPWPPDSPSAERTAPVGIAQRYELDGERDRARALLVRVAQSRPHDAFAVYASAGTLAKLGACAEARAAIGLIGDTSGTSINWWSWALAWLAECERQVQSKPLQP